ncbi:MAG: hypothetical protein KAI24_22135, partial [Planctomycetes bacterium]|nr:hypothetical protein [Planctomycetota bacterium]
MSRLVPILCAAAVVGIGLTAWSQLSASNTELTIPKVAPGSEQPEPDQRRAALHEARCACSLTAMDAAVERAKAATEASPTDAAAWQLLAEAHLERALQRTHLRGMSVGKPTFKSLPEAFAADLDAGAAAVAKARELGDDSANLHRIEAGLMSQRITGLLSAARWNAKIGEALDAAGARDADDPQLHVA